MLSRLLLIVPIVCGVSLGGSHDSLRLNVTRPHRHEAALQHDRVVHRIAFGSCNKHTKNQDYWRAIRARNPDLWIWLGDVIYADTPVLLKWRIPARPETLVAYYEAQLSSPEYGALLSQVPVIGVYDDHDQGTNVSVYTLTSPNRSPVLSVRGEFDVYFFPSINLIIIPKQDADKYSYADEPHIKALSPQLFLDFIGESLDSPRRQQSGIYAHYVLGTAPRRVNVILLDVRTNRDPYWHGDEQDFLGAEQWEWLGRVLADTEAELTLIGSGIQVLSRGDPWIAEMWYKLPQSRARLLALLASARVHGAMFLSGDVHFGELSRIDCPAVGYPLFDVTSSGLTHSWSGFLKRTTVDVCLMGAERAPGTDFYSGMNWGEIEIEWAGDGETRSTLVTMRVWGIDDSVAHIVQIIPLEQLRAEGHDVSATRASALACAAAPLNQGLTPACAAFINSCKPHLTMMHHVKYWSGHAAVTGGLAAVALAVPAAPVFVWFYGPLLPGGRMLSAAILCLAYAVLAKFIDSIH